MKGRVQPASSRAILAVLDAFARAPALRQDYALKGGLPLYYVYSSPRPSSDVDLNALQPSSGEVTEEKRQQLLAFCAVLEEGLAEVAPAYGFSRMVILEKILSDEMPAVLTAVGCAPGAGVEDGCTVEVHVTLSEVICEAVQANIEGIAVHVPGLEDILAEKLKALLQQVARDAVRSSDVYDLWFFTSQSDHPLDRSRVARYLQAKSAVWEAILPVTRSRFRDPAVREHAAAGYDALLAKLPPGAPRASFEEAYAQILRLVDGLDLPD